MLILEWALHLFELPGLPLNAPQCKTGWSVLLVFENGHTAMLILEWALHLFELPGLPVQLVDHDAPASSPHHSHGVLHIRAVGTLWQVDAEHWSGCSGVPELHRLVPPVQLVDH